MPGVTGKRATTKEGRLHFLEIFGDRTVSYMFLVFKRMTIRAQNNQILKFIVVSIPINMVNPKNSWLSIISTFSAFFYKSSGFQFFPNATKTSLPCFLNPIFITGYRAIFSISRRRVFKFFMTVKTIICFISSSYSRFLVTCGRTVFSLIAPGSNMLKNLSAYLTCSGIFNSGAKSSAFSTAKSSGTFSIVSYVTFFATLFTFIVYSFPRTFNFSHKESLHAT